MMGSDEFDPHEVCELICLKCLNRWIDVHPLDMLLKDITCDCGETGFVIATGQNLEGINDEEDIVIGGDEE